MQQCQASSSSPQPSPRLDKSTKAHINKLLRNAVDRQWCRKHGKSLPPPKLPRVVLRVIKEWFALVDDDGSGTLEHHELLAALQAAQIPCDAASITEMIKLMDANRDGCISWDEFEAFMMNEFAAGQQLLSGEFVLPSGTALPFGSMIRQLKRNQMLTDVTQGGEARTKWLHFDINLAADAAELQQAEEAIRIQKEYNETIHLHIQQHHHQQMVAAAALQQWQQQVAPGTATPAAPAAGHVSAAASPVAGAIHAAATAGDAGPPAGSAGNTAASLKARPVGVPRLELGSLSGSGATQQQQQQHGAHESASGGSSRAPVGFLTDSQRAALLGRLPGNMDSLVGSPRFTGSTARPVTQPPCSACLHGIQQPATARSARGAAAKYASLCSSARAAACDAANSAPADAAASLAAKQSVATTAAAPPPPSARLVAMQQPPSSARRPYSASSGHHIVQPQPSRDEWRAVAASCLTQRHAAKCRTARAAKPAAVGPTASAQPADKQMCPAAGTSAVLQLPSVLPPASQGDAAAEGVLPAQVVPGFAVRQWEQASASCASTARRTTRAGAGAQATAAAAANMAASTQQRANAVASSSPYLQHKPAAGGLQHISLPSGAAGGVSSEQQAAVEPPAPSNNDKQPGGTARTGRHTKGLNLGAGCSGAVNSPRAARHAAAAVAVAAAAGGSTSHRAAASSPRHLPDWQLISTARGSGASLGIITPRDKVQSPGRLDRQSTGSSSSCADASSQFDTNRPGKGKGKTPRQEADVKPPGRQLGSVLDASCKYLLSACAVPPAALLSARYVGPVEAAVMKAHTSRQRQ